MTRRMCLSSFTRRGGEFQTHTLCVDSLLIFLARSGHCQRLAPIWETLAEHFEDFSETLTIAKMDATENDLPLSVPFEIQGFPTLKFKKAGTKEFIEYGGDRSLEDLIEFVKKTSANSVEASETETASGSAEEAAAEHDEL